LVDLPREESTDRSSSTSFWTVTGQLANKPTRSQSSRGLVNSWTSKLAEMFDLKFAVNNPYKCD